MWTKKRTIQKVGTRFAMFALAASSITGVFAQSPEKPDNTGKNKRDRAEGTLTPADQGSSAADRDLAKKIRSEITSTKELSTYAQNAKVIVRDGAVTLRGPVRSESEKEKLVTIASRHAGHDKVTNQLEVTPETK